MSPNLHSICCLYGGQCPLFLEWQWGHERNEAGFEYRLWRKNEGRRRHLVRNAHNGLHTAIISRLNSACLSPKTGCFCKHMRTNIDSCGHNFMGKGRRLPDKWQPLLRRAVVTSGNWSLTLQQLLLTELEISPTSGTVTMTARHRMVSPDCALTTSTAKSLHQKFTNVTCDTSSLSRDAACSDPAQ